MGKSLIPICPIPCFTSRSGKRAMGSIPRPTSSILFFSTLLRVLFAHFVSFVVGHNIAASIRKSSCSAQRA